MYKVFFNEKVIYLTDKLEDTSLTFHHVDSKEEVKESISFFESDKKLTELYLYNKDIAKLMSMFESFFTLIEAAGGLIHDNKGELLFIFRRGKWDLPKGKIDDGETPRQAALREVEEETGLKNIEIIDELTQTYHTYSLKNATILKRTFWYDMKFIGEETPVAQREEGIKIAKWFKEDSIDEILKKTYNSVLDVLASKK